MSGSGSLQLVLPDELLLFTACRAQVWEEMQNFFGNIHTEGLFERTKTKKQKNQKPKQFTVSFYTEPKFRASPLISKNNKRQWI